MQYYPQMEVVLKGIYLTKRLIAHHDVKLYSPDNFYIEVLFDEHTHLITRFRAFEHIRSLIPYLEDVRLAV